MQVYSTNERKSCSQTNVSLAHKRVATFEMVQGLPTMFAKVQGFQLFLKKLVTTTKERRKQISSFTPLRVQVAFLPSLKVAELPCMNHDRVSSLFRPLFFLLPIAHGFQRVIHDPFQALGMQLIIMAKQALVD